MMEAHVSDEDMARLFCHFFVHALSAKLFFHCLFPTSIAYTVCSIKYDSLIAEGNLIAFRNFVFMPRKFMTSLNLYFLRVEHADLLVVQRLHSFHLTQYLHAIPYCKKYRKKFPKKNTYSRCSSKYPDVSMTKL